MEPFLTPIEQKIFDYLKTHKTPVTSGTLAKRFIISKSKSNQALSLLERHGFAKVFNIGRTKFYKFNEEQK